MNRPGTLVIGVGSSYRGDDAVGLEVARRLALGRELEAVSISTHEADGISLLNRLADRESVILIDAMKSGARPGAIERFDAAANPLPAQAFPHSTHTLGVAEGIEMGRALGQLPHRLIVYGVEACDCRAGERFSPAVEACVPGVVAAILDELQAVMEGES